MPKQQIVAKKYQIFYPKGLLPEPHARAITGAAHKLDARRLKCLANEFEVGFCCNFNSTFDFDSINGPSTYTTFFSKISHRPT